MEDLRALLEATETIAVVGCSRRAYKPAQYIPAQVQEAGFRIVPVHPSADVLLGEQVYRSLAEIGEPIDLVNVFRPSAETPDVVRAAVAAGAKAVWLQLGIASAEARAIAEEAGLAYVEDRCLGVDLRALGIRKAPA